jgi:hypothetical protein
MPMPPNVFLECGCDSFLLGAVTTGLARILNKAIVYGEVRCQLWIFTHSSV